MMNSTIIGGWEAREALKEASLKLEVGTDWCVGGCQHFSETEEGRARYAELRKRYQSHEQERNTT